VTQARDVAGRAPACDGREEANVFADEAGALVVVVGRLLVELVELVAREGDLPRNVLDAGLQELRAEGLFLPDDPGEL